MVKTKILSKHRIDSNRLKKNMQKSLSHPGTQTDHFTSYVARKRTLKGNRKTCTTLDNV